MNPVIQEPLLKKIRERNSDSQFLAYYNSYYLAKIKFKNALALLDQESSATPSNNASTLLDDAIKYSDIVIANFYNTDFLYDASYIKARSSFLKNISRTLKKQFPRKIN